MTKDFMDMSIEELVDARETINAYLVRTVTLARQGGSTWKVIGSQLGVSGSEALRKYGWVEKTFPKLPETTTGP